MKQKTIYSLTVTFFSIALVLPSATYGQRGARPAGATAGRHSSAISAPLRTSRRNGFAPANGFLTPSVGLTGLYPGTGLGINGINIISTETNLGVEAAIDPATQWNLALSERLLRNSRGIFPGGGYYLLTGGGSYVVPEDQSQVEQQPAPQQPQVIVLQQAPAQQAAVAMAPPPVDAALLPDVGQFTLVLHDGRKIEAVAFSRMNDKIVYITSDGGRRTIALADLDQDATQHLNEERGTPLQLPL
jgi:hypothetical protein